MHSNKRNVFLLFNLIGVLWRYFVWTWYWSLSNTCTHMVIRYSIKLISLILQLLHEHVIQQLSLLLLSFSVATKKVPKCVFFPRLQRIYSSIRSSPLEMVVFFVIVVIEIIHLIRIFPIAHKGYEFKHSIDSILYYVKKAVQCLEVTQVLAGRRHSFSLKEKHIDSNMETDHLGKDRFIF